METDSFFYQLFNQLPQTLFELLGLPAVKAKLYRFDSVELKKSLRIDGLFLPRKEGLPLYFVEVQFQRVSTFYANLFAKVFSYLEANDPGQEWVAVAIFPSRKEEPHLLGPYGDLLVSQRVKRIYLNEVVKARNLPVGLGLLQLLLASERETIDVVPRVLRKAKAHFGGSELQTRVVELVERVLMIRFTDLSLEEMRMKYKLHDIRESKAFQQLCEEAQRKGCEEAQRKGHDVGHEIGLKIGLKEGLEKGREEGR